MSHKKRTRTLTTHDLIQRAIDAIDRKEEIAFDIAADLGMMFDNVKTTAAFVADVANEMVDSMDKWAHLEYVTPDQVRRQRR